MKTISFLASLIFASLYLFPASAAQPKLATQFDFSSDTSPGARKFYFETIPGHRYTLWRSTDLRNWTAVPGYPKTADGLSIEHAFAQGTKEFFQIEPIDNQPPEVVAQYPAVDGFAVGRFADLSIELSDATGIDPASIRLTVGAVGPLAPGAPGLTISGNTINYDSGDAALGPWGSTLTATLVAADTLGHSLNLTWSFRLEPQPQVSANIFVFGSPTAQRSGQRVSGPAAALASRFPAPVGPFRANAPPPWRIEQVLADRIIIAYEAGGAPLFSAGQLICNLAPTKESEIFYRRVISTSNDAATLRLTVMAADAPLTDFVSSGAAAISSNSVVFDLDANGTLISSKAPSGTLLFAELGLDLSGSQFKLLENGYETNVFGITYTSGSGASLVDITADELYWKITPQLRAGVEFGFSGITPVIKSCEAIVSGRASCATVLRAKGRLAGAFAETTIFTTPKAVVTFVGSIGVVPVYTSLNFDFSVKTKAEVNVLIESNMIYRQEAQANFGVVYDRSTGFDWVKSFQASSPDVGGNAAITGEFALKVTLVPKMTAIVYGCAGFEASIEPSGKITTTVSTTAPYLNGKIEGSLDFVLKPAGWLLNNVVFPFNKPELSLNIWEAEWPLIAQTLAFKTQPQSKTVAPGNDVSFTCTLDSPPTLTPPLQWYQNGRLMPGQNSRNLFLTHVNSGHAGNYFVRAKAGNLTADSEIATLTVQAVTPENLDSDLDGVPDIYETNTGIWVSSTNRGTNPYKWDTDGDGLSDAVETNTGVYVSRTNTGTNPNKYDTDGDGINDKREIDLGTEPNPPPAPTGFSLIPGGSFTMGDVNDGNQYGGAPPVTVNVSAFYMAKYETTKELWDEVRTWGAANGYTDLLAGEGKAADHPVHSIDWFAMVKWCNARSQKEGLSPVYTVSGAVMKTGTSVPTPNWSANGYRLPTEAEWEKAARGGVSGQRFPWGNTITHSQANFWNRDGETYQSGTTGPHPTWSNNDNGNYPYSSPVGSFAPNGYGLYDMAGNMWEWCWDSWYGESTYVNGATDPRGPASDGPRVIRGGSWLSYAINCRSAFRGVNYPVYSVINIGFRLARSSVP